jgi:hypothetical protein
VRIATRYVEGGTRNEGIGVAVVFDQGERVLHADPTHHDRLAISCFGCGYVRRKHRSRDGHLYAGECPQCGDVGWFEVNETAAHDFETADRY